MKKIVSLVTVLALAVVMLAACQTTTGSSSSSEPDTSVSQSESTVSSDSQSESDTPREPVTVNIGVLKGPTAMGMVQLMAAAEDGDANGDDYNFTIAGAATEIVPLLAKGDLDIAAVPTNLASVLYANTEGNIQVLAINTMGVLYIVENGDTVHSIEDLAGKTIYASGKAAVPEYSLNYVLEQSGMADKVSIEWKSEHSECVAALANDANGIALLPQPFVTTAQMQNENLRVALDLTEEWNKLQDEDAASTMITGVLVARRQFVEENPEAVIDFLNNYQASVEYVVNNTDEAAALVGRFEIIPEAVAKNALPYCGISFIEGEEMKTLLLGYLEVMYAQNPEAVGGKLPEADFYYAG